MLNKSIIPYVPIADRVKASNDKSQLLCQQFFNMIDHCVHSQIMFNHDTAHGCLSIAPDQINDLLAELSKTDHLNKVIDIHALKDSLSDLIYPKFNGVYKVTSPIWNQTEVTVWQFQLNQIANGVDMQHIENDAELNLDMALSSIRIWRNSLEIGSENKDVIYKQNDLVYKLMDIEERLKMVQHSLEE
ncbi:hypothetical protein [Acinetobacter seifertii]|uniref:hypothetical protein n=1 Tax=Acinetobacter seifertii TaxID=1530123 RepID=UPI00124D5F96|nr:hypothetical protein [Acinetobacter seifertii]